MSMVSQIEERVERQLNITRKDIDRMSSPSCVLICAEEHRDHDQPVHQTGREQ